MYLAMWPCLTNFDTPTLPANLIGPSKGRTFTRRPNARYRCVAMKCILHCCSHDSIHPLRTTKVDIVIQMMLVMCRAERVHVTVGTYG